MKNLRIVVVTYNWPPRNAIGTHRPYSWAKYWSKAGAKVTVLTARKEQFDAPLDLDLPALPDVEVIEVPYRAVGRIGNGLLKLNALRPLARVAKSWLKRRSGYILDPRRSWRDAAKETATQLASEHDVVVSTFGPEAAHLLAYDMKGVNPSLFWVADYRDLWSQTPFDDIARGQRRNWRLSELSTVGERADRLTAVSHDMAQRLEELMGSRATCVRNGFDLDENLLRQRLPATKIRPDNPFRIVYTGGLQVGRRDPLPLVKALVELRNAGWLGPDNITIDFYGERVDVARRLMANSAYKEFIRLMGHVTRDQALAAQQQADILLLLENSAPEARGVLTGKLFEYITAGKPVLCIGSRPEYEIGDVLRTTGTGMVIGPDSYSDIAGTVLETMQGAGLYNLYAPGLHEIMQFSRKHQAQIMLDVVRESSG